MPVVSLYESEIKTGFRMRDHNFLQNDVSSVSKDANSADTDEMQPYMAFHLGLHCLPKVPVYWSG